MDMTNSTFICQGRNLPDLIRIQKVEHDKTLFFTHKVLKHISKTSISLISLLQAVKSAIQNTVKKPGANTEINGPRSEYGFLRTARRQSECRILQSHKILAHILLVEKTRWRPKVIRSQKILF